MKSNSFSLMLNRLSLTIALALFSLYSFANDSDRDTSKNNSYLQLALEDETLPVDDADLEDDQETAGEDDQEEDVPERVSPLSAIDDTEGNDDDEFDKDKKPGGRSSGGQSGQKNQLG